MTWHNAMKSKKLKNGKKKMRMVKGKMLMLARHDGLLHATEALCRHMRWPLAYGATIKDGCVRCPLHQTTHQLDDGALVEWSPFPLLPSYGRLVGAMSKKKDLKIYEVREHDGHVQVRFESSPAVPTDA
jgi:nitrite reductase/ring-hydroxylating ferredoxin subunit